MLRYDAKAHAAGNFGCHRGKPVFNGGCIQYFATPPQLRTMPWRKTVHNSVPWRWSFCGKNARCHEAQQHCQHCQSQTSRHRASSTGIPQEDAAFEGYLSSQRNSRYHVRLWTVDYKRALYRFRTQWFDSSAWKAVAVGDLYPSWRPNSTGEMCLWMWTNLSITFGISFRCCGFITLPFVALNVENVCIFHVICCK